MGVAVSETPDTLSHAIGAEISPDERMQQLKQEEREEHKSPFTNFYQVNKNNSHYLRSCLKECPRALDLLLFLFDHMDRYNAVVCSYKVLEDVLGVSRSTVQRCVAYLRDHGFMAVKKSGTTNVYIANDRLVWNSWGSNVKYCEFPANVVLSSEEQDDDGVKVRAKRKKIIEEVADNEDK